jgi:hypothetical protein
MNLTPVERERITDSMLKIQSARASLEKVEDEKYPNAEEIDSCLESADQHLKIALGYAKPAEGNGKPLVGNPEEEDEPA